MSECLLCCEVKNNFKTCPCGKEICDSCHENVCECPYCKNTNFGGKSQQQRAEELSEYFRQENIQAGLAAAIRLQHEINEESDDEMPPLVSDSEEEYEEEEKEEEISKFAEELFLPIDEETQLQLVLALSADT